MKDNFKKILIVRTDRIGDVVLTTPAIEALKKAYPDSSISLLVAPLTQDLVKGNRFLAEVIVDDRKGAHKGLFGFLKLIREIQSRQFDCVINFHTKKRTNALCFFAGIPKRVGYRNKKFGFLLTDKIPDTRHLGERHEMQYCLDVLGYLGVKNASGQEAVMLQKEAQGWLGEFLAQNRVDDSLRLIAVHPGASCPTKMWPAHKFAEVVNILQERNQCRIVLIGSAENSSAIREMKPRIKSDVIDLTGKTSVGQLAALLHRCDLLISNDSGPVHVADALDTPVVSIFTRNQPGINPERWKPQGKHSQTIITPFKGEMSFAEGRVDDPKYLELIRTEDVIEAVDAIFKLC